MLERKQLGVLALVFLPTMIGAMNADGIAMLLPFLESALDLSKTQVGMIPASFYLGAASLGLLVGWLADGLGPRRTLFLGQAAVGVFMFLASGISNFTALLALLFCAGTGFSSILPTTAKAVMYWFPPRTRGTVVGIMKVGVAAGSGLGALTLPLLAERFGWRVPLFLIGALAVLSAVTVLSFLRDAPDGRQVGEGLRLADLGLIFRNRDLMLTCTATGVLLGTQVTFVSYIILYLKEAVGIPVVAAAMGLAMAQIAAGVARVGWGMISDFLFGGRRRPAALLVGALATLGFIGLIGIGPATPAWFRGTVLLVLGASILGWAGVHTILRAELGGKEHAAAANGFGQMTGALGAFILPPLFGFTVDRTGHYTLGWGLIILLTVLATVLVALVRETGSPAEVESSSNASSPHIPV
ncbi:MAG: MFS transporter [Firmicutes bacterium]|nr:MFS transporter [Bacillota bacterium]